MGSDVTIFVLVQLALAWRNRRDVAQSRRNIEMHDRQNAAELRLDRRARFLGRFVLLRPTAIKRNEGNC